MDELEEDPEFRSTVNLYRVPNAEEIYADRIAKPMMQGDDDDQGDGDDDDPDDDDFPEVELTELVEKMTLAPVAPLYDSGPDEDEQP